MQSQERASLVSPQWKDVNKVQFLSIMPACSFLMRLSLYPLNLVKVRMQATNIYASTFDALRTILRTEGPRALYKGFGLQIMGTTLAGPIYLSTYEVQRNWVYQGLGGRVESEARRRSIGDFLGGVNATMVSQTIVTPIDIVQQLRQMVIKSQQTELDANSVSRLARMVYQQEGLKGFYRGYWVNVCQYAPGSGLMWLNQGIASRHIKHRLQQAGYDLDNHKVRKLIAINALAGALTGIVNSVVFTPLDVVRTRFQVGILKADGSKNTERLSHVVKELWNTDGPKGFFRGITARVLTAIPIFSYIFGGYEALKWFTAKKDWDKQ